MEARISGFTVLLTLWAGVAIIYVPVFFVVTLILDNYVFVAEKLPMVAVWFTAVFVIAKLAVGQLSATCRSKTVSKKNVFLA